MISEEYKNKALSGESHWLKRTSFVGDFIETVKQHRYPVNLKVLDAGCAQGRDVLEMAEHDIDVVGLDNNPHFITQAIGLYPELHFVMGDIENLPYTSGSFSAIYSVNTLFYTNPEKSLPELERVLGDNGIMYITLDQLIVDLDTDKVIHSLDVEHAIRHFNSLEVVSKEFHRRTDKTPFRHKHDFYKFILRKN